MTHLNPRLARWLMVPIPLLMTACCLKDQNIYFSTGTTVGLEATPPSNETPPHVTFGYKRAELALIPVTKLDKQSEPPKPSVKIEQSSARSERGCTEAPSSTQAQDTSISNKTKDAFSVLAAFHLAVNWFGPAKIEQYFATGCAATHLIKGLTEEEEDKKKAEEAHSDVEEAKRLFRASENDAKQLEAASNKLEQETADLRDSIAKNEKELNREKDRGGDARELLQTRTQLSHKINDAEFRAMRLDSAAENHNRLSDAKAKAQRAIKKADEATKSEVVRSQAQGVKTEATQLIESITNREPDILTRFKKARCTLKKVQDLSHECETKSMSRVSP